MRVDDMKSHYFQLYFYTVFGSKSWISVDWQSKFDIDLNKANSVRLWYQRMRNNQQEFSTYYSAIYGLSWWSDKINHLFYPLFTIFGIPYFRNAEQQWTLCCDSYYFKDDVQLAKCGTNSNDDQISYMK